MPLRELHVMDEGAWRAIIGEDVLPPAPPVVGPPPVYITRGTSFSGAGAIAPTWPPGHQPLDISVKVIHTSAQALGTLPTGWTRVAGSPFTIGTPGAPGSVGLEILWKRSASNNEAAFSVGDSGDHQAGRDYLLRGCVETGSPIDVVASATLVGPSASVSIPGPTTLGENRFVLTVIGWGTDGPDDQVQISPAPTNNSLTGFDLLDDTGYSINNGGGFAILGGAKLHEGPVDPTTLTLRDPTAQVKVSIAFKPATSTVTPPPAVGIFRTFVGTWDMPTSRLGNNPTPDCELNDSSGSNYVTTGGYIDDAIAAGACLYIRVTGGNTGLRDAQGHFSTSIWDTKFTTWANGVEGVTGGLTKLRNAVRDGVVRAIMGLDDYGSSFGENSFSRAVVFEELEHIGATVKARYPWLPIFGRRGNDYHKQIATLNGVVRQYRYFDAGYATYRFSSGLPDGPSPDAYFAKQVADGEACGLGCLGGINLLNQGSGTDGAWGCRQGSDPTKCGMSPVEIIVAGAAAIANPKVHGFGVWSWDGLGITGPGNYWRDPSIQSAMQSVHADSTGRNDPPINVRGDLQAA